MSQEINSSLEVVGGLSPLSVKIKSFLDLFRIPNCLALGFLFITSRRHYGLDTSDVHEYMEAITWVLLAAFAYCYNDLCDIEVDRINKPRRALPSGVLSTKAVKLILVILLILIMAITIAEWRGRLLWPLGALVVGLVYSSFLRTRTALFSNVAAGCLVAAVPLSGLPLHGEIRVWELAAGIMLLMFGRELQKDVVDYEGDMHYRPVPVLIRFSRLFDYLYPLGLAVSAILLYSASHSSGSAVGSLGSFCLLAMLMTAAIGFIVKNNSHQLQASIIKMVSYLLVVILTVRSQ